MNMKRVNELLAQHGVSFADCKGCSICTEIQSLTKEKTRLEEEFKHILDKGPDMKLSEVKFLLEKGFSRQSLQKAIQASHEDYQQILKAIGLYKDPKKIDTIQKDKVIELRLSGMMWKDISKHFDITQEYLMQLRRKWGINHLKYSKKDQLKEFKKPSASERNNFSQKTKEHINDLQGSCCYVCESPHVQYHHVKFRSQSGRGVKRNGLPLCNFHHNDSTYGIHHNRKFKKQINELFIERFGPDFYKDEHDLYKEKKIAEPSKLLLEEFFKNGGFE